MSLVDDIAAFKLLVYARITNKFTLKAIKKADVADSFDDLADLLGAYSPQIILKTEADLLDSDDDQNWYLPYLDNDGNEIPEDVDPLWVKVNGLKVDGYSFEEAFTPPRIYGFANNEAQVIKVKVV